MNKETIKDEDVIDLYAQGLTQSEIANMLDRHVRRIAERIAKLKASGKIGTVEILQRENVKLVNKLQKQSDLNRIKNKTYREHSRLSNAIGELDKEFIEILKKHELPKKIFRTKEIKSNTKSGAILHLTDLHLNELVDIVSNKYDFNIASQRIRKFVNDARTYFKAKNVKDVFVCMTGDLMNSDRRLDEILSQATNRAKALFLSVMIIEQALLDLQQDFNVSVVSVIGNESRITKDIGWSDEVASDNYDFMIYNTLKLIFRKSNIRFFDGNATEQVIEIVGQNILICHGNQIKGSKMEQSIQKIIGKYATQKINISFIISGHLHSCRTSDLFSRGGSVVGANDYSWGALQLASRASQNAHIFYSNGNRDSIKIDLQEINDVEGYPIIKELESYNAKSLSKAKKKTTIIKLVV
ncbi:MAG: metallophosphoesterase [Novosphingobium sp.]|nr:metallophosphoesterase [Novosphingobium sp.]